MTKQEEIALLDEFVGKLGRDSYTGPWLNDQLPGLRMAILDDLTPEAGDCCSMIEARARAKSIIQEAQRERDRLQAAAEEREKRADAAVRTQQERARRLAYLIEEFKKEAGKV